jgi:small subunit ribosomal protein S16
LGVRLRLTRIGRRNKPFYRIIAADSRSPRDGKFIEVVGRYNPLTEPETLEIKEERVLYWINNGALMSDTVRTLFKRNGLIFKWHLKKKGFDETKITEELNRWQAVESARRERLVAKSKEKKAKKAETKAEEQQASAGETTPA